MCSTARLIQASNSSTFAMVVVPCPFDLSPHSVVIPSDLQQTSIRAFRQEASCLQLVFDLGTVDVWRQPETSNVVRKHGFFCGLLACVQDELHELFMRDLLCTGIAHRRSAVTAGFAYHRRQVFTTGKCHLRRHLCFLVSCLREPADIRCFERSSGRRALITAHVPRTQRSMVVHGCRCPTNNIRLQIYCFVSIDHVV